MGTRLSAQEASAYKALDRLLYREWDPIGVYPIDGPEDEYRMYLPGFWELVKGGASAEEISSYLRRIEEGRITLTTSEEHRLDIERKASALMAAWTILVRR